MKKFLNKYLTCITAICISIVSGSIWGFVFSFVFNAQVGMVIGVICSFSMFVAMSAVCVGSQTDKYEVLNGGVEYGR